MASFEEKELAILRSAVDRAEAKAGKQLTNSDEVQKIIQIVEMVALLLIIFFLNKISSIIKILKSLITIFLVHQL